MPLTKGAQLAIKGVMMAAQVGLTMLTKIEGPRLDNLDATLADYGTPLNYFWGERRLACQIVHAEKLREKKTTSKTKGGKYSEYKYFGTWMVVVAGHPIDAIKKIRMDKHLVYDMSSPGPISPLGGFLVGLQDAPVKLAQGRNMRIYLGDQTEPDRRYEEWCEDRYGPGTAPAYKGMSLIFFEDIPLEKFGNRIPQIEVDAVNTSSNNFLYEAITDSGSGEHQWAPDYSRLTFGASIWDTPTRSKLFDLSFVPSAIGSDGRLYHAYDVVSTPALQIYTPDGHPEGDPIASPIFMGDLKVVDDGAGDVLYVLPYGAVLGQMATLSGATLNQHDFDFAPTTVLTDSVGNTWLLGREFGVSEIKILCFSGPRMGDGGTLSTSNSGFVQAGINAAGELVTVQGTEARRISLDTLTTIATATVEGSDDTWFYGDSFWQISGTTVHEYSMDDLSELREEPLNSWTSGSPGFSTYDPINHAIISHQTPGLVWRYLDRVGNPGTLLSDIVEEVAGWCGLDDVDVSDLDQVVDGYSVTQGPGKDMIAPLLDIHDVDARPHDFTCQFIKRGRASEGTIETSEFVREGDEPRYTVTVKQDTDLPRRLSLNFADRDKEQQNNTVISQRPLDGTDATREQTIDLSTYVATPSDAQKYADRWFRRQWNERETISNALTCQYLAVEPGDPFDLDLDGAQRYARATKWTLSQGRIALEWTRDALSLTNLGTGTGAEMDGRDDEVIYIPGATKGIVLDIPLVQDSHNDTNPLLYYGAGTYAGASWPGAVIFEVDSEGDNIEWNAVESADKAVWGYATDVLGSANPGIWDGASSVNITVNGTLTSSTRAIIDANPMTNLAVLGNELFNFATATLESDGSYTLADLKRGRRGSEWSVDDHAVGDLFVLVSSLDHDARGLGDIGSDLTFKAQTAGRSIDGAYPIEIDFTAASIKPYAPAHFTATRDTGSNDWDFAWVRRTRVGGNWSGGIIPLGETTEAYKLRILDEDGVVVRTIDVTSPEATYTSAQQTTDFGGAQTEIRATVCQIADAVEGYQTSLEDTAPYVRGLGSIPDSAATVSPSLPTGTTANDILLLAVETDGGDTIAAPSGYTAVTNSPQQGSDVGLHLFWKRATFGETAPTVVRTGTHVIARVIGIANANPFGNPFDATAGGTDSGAPLSVPGLTTTTNNCLVVDVVAVADGGIGNQASSWANADLTDFTEYGASSLNNGFGIAAGVKASAGAVGATTLTMFNTNNTGMLKVALRPA